ncbi:MAG: LapA family protein [Nostocaceae cyanobacterium]|nr:LapA family protein [Nostocaceae cyanobacterium]
MRILTILALLIAIVTVVFALQNSTPVMVQFLGWRFEDSMALVLLLTFTLGVLFGLLVSLPTIVKGIKKKGSLTRKIEQQKHQIEDLNQKLSEFNQSPQIENYPDISINS